MAKKKTVKIPMKDFVKEHKKLIQVLESPSHKDDKREAKEQKQELQAELDKSKTDVETRSPKDKKLSNKIYTHNRKKLHTFVKKMKKSLDFKDTTVSVDSNDQLLSEKTTNAKLVEYVKMHAGLLKADGSVAKIPFPTGMLTLSQREAGIYHGHFQDRDGQVVEKFDSQTVEIICKMLELKSLVPVPTEPVSVPASEQEVSMLAAAHDRIDMVHNRIDAIEQRQASNVKGIKIKYGDFELEIRKSIRDFVNDFKTNKSYDRDTVRKAISSWRKKHGEYMQLGSDIAAAKELLTNWSQHEDSFCQFVDALTRMEEESDRS
jgi:hypothetical protein